jgi:hypothetical protein
MTQQEKALEDSYKAAETRLESAQTDEDLDAAWAEIEKAQQPVQ